MEAGKEGIKFEAGPFSFYGMMALTASSGKNGRAQTHRGSNVTSGRGEDGGPASLCSGQTEICCHPGPRSANVNYN